MTKMKFARFGGLSPVKQDQYTTKEDKGFHNPPRRHGLYAFPYPYIEKFLLGATDQPGHISNKTKWLRDEAGNRIKYNDFYDRSKEYDLKLDGYPINPEYKRLLKKLNIKQSTLRSYYDEKDEVHYITVLNKPRVFEYDGELWHHLGHHLKPHQVISTSGSWVLTDMDNYQIALRLEVHDTKGQMLKSWKSFNADINDVINRDPYKTMFAKDHLEVFIESL
jgi:hypothetical protein